MAQVVSAVCGREFIQFHAALQIQHQDDLKKRTNRKTDTWQSGCFRKQMIIASQHNKPPPFQKKMNVLPKTFVQIILAANWLVWHSIPSPKQQRRPLPSLLSVSSSMGYLPTLFPVIQSIYSYFLCSLNVLFTDLTPVWFCVTVILA